MVGINHRAKIAGGAIPSALRPDQPQTKRQQEQDGVGDRIGNARLDERGPRRELLRRRNRHEQRDKPPREHGNRQDRAGHVAEARTVEQLDPDPEHKDAAEDRRIDRERHADATLARVVIEKTETTTPEGR